MRARSPEGLLTICGIASGASSGTGATLAGMAKPPRVLSSDELGAKGEARFSELCADAKLIANPSTRDRYGWDFFVEFQSELVGSASLDAREIPPPCLVQVKTTWMDNYSIRLRLSSAERLAKSSGPALIYVQKVYTDLSFGVSSALHFDGDLLNDILKRLREAERTSKSPNKVFVDYDIRMWGEEVASTGSALAAFFSRIKGQSWTSYIDAKKRQIRDSGFSADRLRIKAIIESEPHEEVVEAFLVGGTLRATGVEAFERRFDIELPIPEIGGEGQLTLIPQATDRCEIVLRPPLPAEPLRFSAKQYSVPSALTGPGQCRILLRADLFDLSFDFERPSSLKLDMNLKFSTGGAGRAGVKAKPHEWADFYSFVSIASSGQVDLELKPRKLRSTLSAKMVLDLDAEEKPRWDAMAKLSLAAARLLKLAAVPNTRLKAEDIAFAGEDISDAVGILDDPLGVSLAFKSLGGTSVLDPINTEMLYFRPFPLAQYEFCYCLLVSISGTPHSSGMNWKTSSVKMIGTVRMKEPAEEFSQFANRMKSLTGVESYMVASTASWVPENPFCVLK